jgi:hypothetical protein
MLVAARAGAWLGDNVVVNFEQCEALCHGGRRSLQWGSTASAYRRGPTVESDREAEPGIGQSGTVCKV